MGPRNEARVLGFFLFCFLFCFLFFFNGKTSGHSLPELIFMNRSLPKPHPPIYGTHSQKALLIFGGSAVRIWGKDQRTDIVP